MNQSEDDYAALHSYIQLVESEIDQVINGGLPSKGSAQTEAQPPSSGTHQRPPTLVLQKNPERILQEKASKPPKGSSRENRIINSGVDNSGRGNTELSSRRRDRKKVMEMGNTAKQEFIGKKSMPRMGEKFRRSSDDDIIEVEDLYVVEDIEGKDELLRNILFSKENNNELANEGFIQEEKDVVFDTSFRAAPLVAKIKRPTDLQRLLDTDRDSLILGPDVRVREKDCQCCTDVMSRCSLTIHHCDHHQHRHQHFHRHHRCTSEPDVCPALQLGYVVTRHQSLQPCHCHHQYRRQHHHQHHHQRGCYYCSVSDNDLLSGFSQRKSSDPLDRFRSGKCADSAEDVPMRKRYGSLNGECCLTESCHVWDRHRRNTYTDSEELCTTKSFNALDTPHRGIFLGPFADCDTRNCSHILDIVRSLDPLEDHGLESSLQILPKVHKSSPPDNITQALQHPGYSEPIYRSPKGPASFPVQTGAISVGVASLSSDLEIFEEDKDQDVSTSDRSYTDSELRDIFDSPENIPTHRDSKQKLSRKSYPDNSLIISPPPGFGSPDSEEEMWVKVRLVTGSQDDLSCRSDERRKAGRDHSSELSEFHGDKSALNFVDSRQTAKCDTNSPTDLHTPCDSLLDQDCDNADEERKSSSNNATRRSLSSLALSGTRIIPPETPVSGRSGVQDHTSETGDCMDSQRAGSLHSNTLNTLLTPDGNAISTDLTIHENILSISGDILRPISTGYSKSGSKSPSQSSVGEYYPTSEVESSCIEQRSPKVKHQNIYSSFRSADPTGSRPELIDTEFVLTPKSLESSFSLDPLPDRTDTATVVIPDSLDSSVHSELSSDHTHADILVIQDSLDSSINSELSQDHTDSDVLFIPDSLNSSVHSELLPTLEDEQNNNTGGNLLSMCLASDCKLLKSCSSQRLTQPQEKLDSEISTIENHNESPVNTTMLARKCSNFSPEISNSLQNSVKSNDERSDISAASSRGCEKATDAHFELETSFSTGEAGSSCTGDSEAIRVNDEKQHKGTGTKGVLCLDEKQAREECSFRMFSSVGASDDCCVKKVALKDTAVQTSLELDVFVSDISETRNNHRNDTIETNKDRGKGSDDYKSGSNIRGDSLDCKIQNNGSSKTCDKEGKLLCRSGHFKRSRRTNEAMTMTAEVRTPFRVSLLRSKSVHERGIEGDKRGRNRDARPDASGLSGNLRELSHLNIDVSQRLIGGEQRFVVTNGSPDLQVVVNALTPVLSRRSRARNTRRVHNLDAVTEMPNSFKPLHGKEPSSTETEVGDFAADVNHRSRPSENSISYIENNHKSNAIPVYARLRSYDGSNNISIETHESGLSEGHTSRHVGDMKELKHNRISRSSSARASNEVRNNTTPEDPAGKVKEEFLEELEQGKNSLFLSPKLSHTWHGSSAGSTHRSSPRMGVGKVDGGIKYARGENGSIRPVALAPNPQPPTSLADQHANTMPVISRTLLDALHKRYCAYQYSNHYQTIQQFSLLKLDSTITSGNQAVTALLVEPRHARGHEVQAAPPSPEIMARLRMLKNSIDLSTNKSGNQPVMCSTHKEPSVSIPQPPTCQQILLEQSPIEVTGSFEDVTVENTWYMTPESSPDLQDKLNHSGRHHTELEATEALKWLRAAGFPQYAQMFDDGQFPVDMGIVERDHDFLDKDSLQSLFRRLETLNRYAGIKRDSHPCKKTASEEEDEDDFCALSERWEYQKSARRWSRKDLSSSPKTTVSLKDKDLAVRSGSHDSLLADQDSGSQIGDSPLLESKISHQSVVQSSGTSNSGDMVSISHRGLTVPQTTPENSGQTGAAVSPQLRRAASDKTKTTKGLFKKMEGMKSAKSRRQSHHRNIVEISGPVVADRENMQAKLSKLNCVDILHEADTQMSPPLMRGNSSERKHGLSSGTESRHLSSRTYAGQPSPQSPQPSSSPRPRSDFLLRSNDEKSHTPLHSGNQERPNSTSPNQRPSLVHDSSFEEYYQAQTAFLQNLQSSPRSAPEGVRKNNSENNLMEIFLVPQDHQPGRFPRVLQNGYIETEACGTAVNVRTGSVRLGRSSCMKSDHTGARLRSPQPSGTDCTSNRLSVYDNCSPSEGKRSEKSGNNSSFIPSTTEIATSGESKQPTGNLPKECSQQEVNSDSSRQDSVDTSRESSVVRTTWNFSDHQVRSSDHERSVSFESSTSSQSFEDNAPVTTEELASDAKSSQIATSDSVSLKSKVTHSSSVDSYFKDCSGQIERAASESSKTPPAGTFQENYDEFDRILQELYKNINDLTTFMDKDKNEKTPRLVRAATSPLPAGNTHPHTPLHVVTPQARPVLKPQQPVPESNSPSSSATSDLVPSPASPRSPQDSNGPLDFYGRLELDHENSSSGGEGSNTAESGSEDQEMVFTDVSQDDSLDLIIDVPRERRDSGVGHSLTRAPSDRRRKKIRWHSFQKSHRPDISSRAMQINSLTVGQLVRLQKLSLLRLTGIMEKCLPVNKSGWNWMVPRFMKRHKAPDFNDKNVFGVPLSVMAQRTGQPLPQCVLYAMRYLRRTCPSAVGIFRKSGVKSKIQQLRDYLEGHPDTTNFDGENSYNVADMLKTYFRDLPECLLTNKMSETFRSIYTYVPPAQRLDAIQAAILLLPDENREVLQSILLFLSDISEHEADHQMNASNLAVCFTPTVFHLGPRQSLPYSPKRNRKNSSGVPDPREIMEQKAAHECLLMMITQCKKLFTVPSNLFRQLQVQSVAHIEPSLPLDIGSCPSDVRAFGQERIQMVLKESHDKNRGWVPTMTIGDVEVFHRKPLDDCLLKEWKLVVDIEAPPVEVLRRIMHERHTWDEDLLSWSVVERLDPHSDIFQFVLNSMAPHPPRNFCALRYWRSDLNKGACALITKSVEHSDALEIHGVWAVDLGTYYLMEPCGSGRSRLTYITRVDTRGRMPEWYTKIFGHICANFLDRLKESFKQDASGPETKV